MNFRELLAARGLLGRPRGAAALLPPVRALRPDPMLAATAVAPESSPASTGFRWAGVMAGGACSVIALGIALWRRRLGF